MFEMETENALLSKWRTLHSADREAILDALQAEQREAFKQMLADEGDCTGRERRGEYRNYSPWLARLLADCREEAPAGRLTCALPVTPSVAASLTEIHAELRDKPSSSRTNFQLPHGLRSLLRTWGLAA